MIQDAKNRNVHKGHEAAFTIKEEIEEELNNTETALAVVDNQALAASLGQALHTTTTFTGSARRRGGEESSNPPRRLTWCTGNNNMFAANGKTPLEAARGWFIDKPDEDEMFPDDYELMDTMEILCDLGLAREVQVEHSDESGGKNRRVPSWQIYEPSLFVVCEGIPSKSEMERDNSDRWGVAYGWRPGEGGRSQLKFHCFIKELMDNGYNGLFIASFSSFCTPPAIAALKAHEYVLRFVDKLRAKAGDVQAVPFYAYALPIKSSVKTKTAGQGDKSREIYYPIPAIPRLSERDPEAALAYLSTMAITEEQAYILEYNGRVEQAVEWSVKESARIIAGKDNQIEENISVNEAPISDTNPPF